MHLWWLWQPCTYVYVCGNLFRCAFNVLVVFMSCKLTPNVTELLPVRQYRCEHCTDQVFGNQSHYQLHLRRRHKLNVVNKKDGESTYHCPVENCIYHAEHHGGRGFTSLRLLRQHYQKIHMVKEYKCNECNETFLLSHHLEKHQCCSSYDCPQCGLTYTSKASLQTHMRRKNHLDTSKKAEVEKVVPPPSKVALSSLNQWKKEQKRSPSVEQAVQPLICSMPIVVIPYAQPQLDNAVQREMEIDTHVRTEEPASNENELPLPNFTAEEVERLLRDMETQTDDVDLDALDVNNEMLAPLLRNIQTQTLDNRHHQGTMTELDQEDEQNENGTTRDYGSYQEQEQIFGLQNSAHMHTQTCDELFEELGLSDIQTQTHCPDGLYNTQHTQTCDEMLDELLENFQSTCTQTRWLDWQEAERTSNE